MRKIAVVILNFNGRKYLEQFLPSIIQFSGDAQVIVADNDSTDDSIKFLGDKYPDLTLIELAKNHGFAGGYNEALKQVNADYFAIINSDVEVTENWLGPLLDFLIENDEYASVQPKIKDWNSKELFEYAGASGGFIDFLGYPFCRGRIFDTLEKDEGQYDTTVDVDWTSGACMLIRSEAFRKAKGFDNDFFAHMEEIDLCWRLRSSNWKLACVPESTVYHVGGGTLHKSSPRKTYLNFRNGLSLLVKNLPISQLLWKVPVRLFLDGIAALKFALETAPSHLIAILKAHIHFYIRIPKNVGKRGLPSAPRKLNLLSQYFIKKRKRYAELDQ